jgi:hypothetical protein
MSTVRRVLVLAAISALCGGCGVGEYENRMERRLVELRKAAVFDVLYQATELPNTPILVRVPKSFTQRLVEGAELDGKKIDAQRAKIPVLDLPTPLVTYESVVQDSSGGKLPYYVYLTAAPAAAVERLRSSTERRFQDGKPVDAPSQPARMDSTGELFQRLEKAFPQAKLAWQDVSCPTPSGEQVAWQRLVASGEQEFRYIDREGLERRAKLPGRLEIWARYYGDYLVLIAWRVPDSLVGPSQIDTLAPLVAGSTASR